MCSGIPTFLSPWSMGNSRSVWENMHLWLQRVVKHQRLQADWQWCLHSDSQSGQPPAPCPQQEIRSQVHRPIKVLRQMNPFDVTSRTPGYRISPSYHATLLKSAHETPSGNTSNLETPTPLDIKQSLAYLVREILDSRRSRGHQQHLVNWEVYGQKKDARDILNPSLTRDFLRDHHDQPIPVTQEEEGGFFNDSGRTPPAPPLGVLAWVLALLDHPVTSSFWCEI